MLTCRREGIGRIEELTFAIQDTLSRHAIVLEQMAVLLRHHRRIPRQDLSGLSHLDTELSQSATEIIGSESAATRAGDHAQKVQRYQRIGVSTEAGINIDALTLNVDCDTSIKWSSLIDSGSSTPIFHVYSDVLFDFITEMWPNEDGSITYFQIRNFQLYSGLKDVLPDRKWVEQYSTFICSTINTLC
jgi:hypothetical protein